MFLWSKLLSVWSIRFAKEASSNVGKASREDSGVLCGVLCGECVCEQPMMLLTPLPASLE